MPVKLIKCYVPGIPRNSVFHFIIGIDIVGRWFAGPAQAYKPPLKAAMLLYSIIKDPTSKYYRDE